MIIENGKFRIEYSYPYLDEAYVRVTVVNTDERSVKIWGIANPEILDRLSESFIDDLYQRYDSYTNVDLYTSRY